jgi:hypothetical protein
MSSKQLVINVKVEPDEVIDLIEAAHFLGIKSLTSMCFCVIHEFFGRSDNRRSWRINPTVEK